MNSGLIYQAAKMGERRDLDLAGLRYLLVRTALRGYIRQSPSAWSPLSVRNTRVNKQTDASGNADVPGFLTGAIAE
ncbi:hypothetical protein GCM10027341_34550 [Spirosoma knui]